MTPEDLEIACKLSRSLYEEIPPRSRWSRSRITHTPVKIQTAKLIDPIYLNGCGLEGVERDAFILAYDMNRGHVSNTAKLLKVSRTTVYQLMKKYLLLLAVALIASCSTSPTPVVVPPTPVPQPLAARRQPAQKTITIGWQDPVDPDWAGTPKVTEVWATRDFQNWYPKTEVTTNTAVIIIANEAEFYKIRYRYTLGPDQAFSDWSRK